MKNTMENKQEIKKTIPEPSAVGAAQEESPIKRTNTSINQNEKISKGAGICSPLMTVDAETLLSTPIDPIQFIIEDLLPQGIHLLAGNPKVGKSWLVLWFCLQVSKGEPVWKYATKQGTVLYLCLEDSYQRIQSRLSQLTDDARDNLFFSLQSEDIEHGLCSQIEAFKEKHLDTCLVVIDTFQKVRPMAAEGNLYASDYQDISKLKEVTDRLGLAVIIVHHLRKKTDDDPYRMVSGTNAMTGAVDSSFILQKTNPSSNEAILYVQGRDIEERELRLQFEGLKWHLLSGDEIAERQFIAIPAVIEEVKSYMLEQRYWKGTATELLRQLNLEMRPNVLTKLVNQHKDYLMQAGILYQYNRTNKDRWIVFSLVSDDGDGHLPPGESIVTTVTK